MNAGGRQRENVYIDPTAQVEDGVVLGAGTKIWHFAHVMSGAKIGEGCTLGQNVFIGPGVEIGKNVKIQNNVAVYEGVCLEDDVFCGPSCVFTNVDRPRSGFPTDRSKYLNTLVKRGATIGANATIVCGNTLGEYCFVGAGSVVTKDVPAYGVVYGTPAKPHGWICQCGRKLDFRGEEAVCDCGRRYQKQGDRVGLEGIELSSE